MAPLFYGTEPEADGAGSEPHGETDGQQQTER
jgi:hypothetical protein